MRGAEAGTPTGDLIRLIRRRGISWISRNTFYNWQKKYDGLEASDARRLKQLDLMA